MKLGINIKDLQIRKLMLLSQHWIKQKKDLEFQLDGAKELILMQAVVNQLFKKNDKKAFNIAAHRITISTAGILPKINQFINDKLKYNLAISLNASEDRIRDILMPINKKWPISDLISIAKHYNELSRSKITFEYVLIDSINDSIDDANRLGLLLKNTGCKLNIIPFNEIGSEYKRPSNNTIENFVKALHQVQQGFRILVRWSKGTDINAGCGQLAINE